MAAEIFLRAIPLALQAGIESGELGVYGSAIREVASGRYAGFLQETSGLDSVAQAVLGANPTSTTARLASPLGSAIDVAGFAATGYQNEQIKRALATVQSMQVADLALGAFGIGVSIAGFALLNRKIGRVEHKVDALGEHLARLARGIEALRLEPIRQDFTRLRTAARQLDQGWSLPDPVREWEAVARDADHLIDGFERRIDELLTVDETDLPAAEPFLDALALAVATAVAARLASGQDAVARLVADRGAAALAARAGRLHLGQAAIAHVDAEITFGSPDWQTALDGAVAALTPVVENARQHAIAAESTSALLGELDRQGIAGRDWLSAARAETERPLLCLLPPAA